MANQYLSPVPQLDSGYSFEEWVEVLDTWMTSNDIQDEPKKRAIFLTNLGSKAYHTLRSLLQPQKPVDKTYKECVDALQNHFSPKPTEIVQRYKFYTCTQASTETIPQFVAKLRQSSEGCNFRDLNTMLRDRLVVGCRDHAIQRKLLSEHNLTCEKALSIATAMEVANQDLEQLRTIGKAAGHDSVHVHPELHKVHTEAHAQAPRGKQYKPGKSNAFQPKTPKQRNPNKPAGQQDKKCWRCGGTSHPAYSCRFKNETCHQCSVVGHTQSQCASVQAFRKARKQKASHYMEGNDSDSPDDSPHPESMSHITDSTLNKLSKNEPYHVSVKVNGKPIRMEVDTGSPWTIVSAETFRQIGSAQVKQSNAKLNTYTGDKVPIVGEAIVEVGFSPDQAPHGQIHKLPLLVVEEGVSLLGRDWLQKSPELLAQLANQNAPDASQSSMHNLQDVLQEVLNKHAELFDDSTVGVLKGYQAKVYPQEENNGAKFYKAAPVSYAARKQIDRALDRLLEDGIIKPVKTAEFACPIIAVPKPDGKMRICGNYKLTANKVLKVEQYPLPTLEDLLQELEGGEKFTKLDLSHAYHQIELDPEARKYTTINTLRGLFEYTRLPFGIASAPAMFQRTMEGLLADIPMCKPYLDDIIISGKTDEDHLENLEAVLSRLESNGLRLKKEKCELMKDSVDYLGHRLDKNGLRPLQDKLDAIRRAERPVNQSQLQAYLGLLGYYRKFIPNLSQEIAPLTEMLKAEFRSTSSGKGSRKPDPKFNWGKKQEQAFQKSKRLLQSDSILTHYDPAKPILLQTDASPYGLGAVISHVEPDGRERPIAFASRTLKPSEVNYAQYEKESLSIIFGLKKFHKHLHGRSFTIVTDHKPLIGLFGDRKPASPMASARVARWHMILSAYDYAIVHKEGKRHQNADALSRLPLRQDQSVWAHPMLAELDELPPVQINMMEIDSRPVEADEVRTCTKKDPVLTRVTAYILHGWPNPKNVPPEFKAFVQKKEELSIEDDIVLWGHRVVIPDNKEMRNRIIDELHGTHPGIVKMKALARSYAWWPGIDKDLERKVRTCSVCQAEQRSPQATPIHPWEFPEKPWMRLHIDYAFIDNQDVLIVVDAHSKWIEAALVNKATAYATIVVLRRLFATHGLPETIVSDNGSQFVSEEFARFLSSNNIHHIQTAPKHPSSNGLAERAVQTVKKGVKKTAGDNLEMRLQKFLLMYRLTPQETTGKCPCELLLKRRTRSKLDQIRPDLSKKVKRKQTSMKSRTDRRKDRRFDIRDKVQVKNFSSGPTWLYGKVVEIIAESMYLIELDDGRQVRRHVDQMRHYMPASTDDQVPQEGLNPAILPLENQIEPPLERFEKQPTDEHATSSQDEVEQTTETVEIPIESNTNTTPIVFTPNSDTTAKQVRTSQRQKKMPNKFQEFIVYR